MHVISRKALRLFWEKHPDSETALRRRLKVMRYTDFKMEAMSVSTKELQDNWASIRRILTIRNEGEYDKAVKRL